MSHHSMHEAAACINMAWADGEIHNDERKQILGLFDRFKVRTDERVYDLIERALESRPSMAEIESISAEMWLRRQRSHNEYYQIFLSHKQKDAHYALAIKKAIEHLGGQNQLRVFVSGEIQGGAKWRDTVHDAIKRSDMLLLLYTRPDDEWKWCMYEAGYFAGEYQTPSGGRPVVVFRRKDIPTPSALDGYQALTVTPASSNDYLDNQEVTRIRDWIHKICLDNGLYNGNPPAALVDPIIEALTDPYTKDDLAHAVNLHMREIKIHVGRTELEELQATGELPPEARLTGDRESLGVFGLSPTNSIDKGHSWQNLLDNMNEYDQCQPLRSRATLWAKCIPPMLQEISMGITKSRLLPMLRSVDENSLYRPSIYSAANDGFGGRYFTIVFSQIPETIEVGMFTGMGALHQAVTACRLFRCGVIEPAINKLGAIQYVPVSLENRRTILREIKRSMSTIFAEIENRSVPHQGALEIFAGTEYIDEINEMFREWFGCPDEPESGMIAKINKGIEDNDHKKVYSLMLEIAKINLRYMRLTLDLYGQKLGAGLPVV